LPEERKEGGWHVRLSLLRGKKKTRPARESSIHWKERKKCKNGERKGKNTLRLTTRQWKQNGEKNVFPNQYGSPPGLKKGKGPKTRPINWKTGEQGGQRYSPRRKEKKKPEYGPPLLKRKKADHQRGRTGAMVHAPATKEKKTSPAQSVLQEQRPFREKKRKKLGVEEGE